MIQRIGATRSPALAVALPPTLELEACYRYCEALCRSRHHNYPVGSLFARQALRKHIFAAFAFARVADDFADEPGYEGRRTRELDRWEEQLRDAYRGHATHPVFVALAHTVDKFALPITELHDAAVRSSGPISASAAATRRSRSCAATPTRPPSRSATCC